MTEPTPAPETGPATVPAVATWLERDPDNPPAGLDLVVDAVNDLVTAPVGWLVAPAAGDAWPARYRLGAVMLAGRLWRRRNSPAGVESFAGDAAVYVSRNDPDVAQLLGLGAYTPPAVG